MKKNLAILIYSLASGGAERVTSILLSELKQQYNITLVLMNDTIFYNVPNDIKIVYIEKSSAMESGIKKLLKLPILAWRYKKVCDLYKIDVSLSLLVRPNYINILSKIFGNSNKAIISERSFLSEEFKESKIQYGIRKILIPFFYNRADLIIAISKGTAKDLIEEYHIKQEKIKVIYNPLDFNLINKNSSLALKNNKNTFTFITIGRLDRGKNHQLLIESIAKLDNLDVKLVIIGDGIERKKLTLLVKELKLENKIEFKGLQKNPFKFLFESDCFVFATNYESFGNVIVEALACGLPVISTDCKSGPREILAPQSDVYIHTKNSIEQEEYGLLTPVNDLDNMVKSMTLIINNHELRSRYKNHSKKRANDFNKEKIINEWIDVIELKNHVI